MFTALRGRRIVSLTVGGDGQGLSFSSVGSEYLGPKISRFQIGQDDVVVRADSVLK